MESTMQRPAFVAAQTTPKAKTIAYWVVTDALLPADELHRLRATAPAAGGQAFTHLGFPGYFRVELSLAKLLGVVLLLAPAAGAAQGVGLRRLRHRPRFGAHRTPLSGRWPGGVELGGSHRRALGALVLLLAPLAHVIYSYVGEGLTVHRSLFRSQKREEAAARSLPSTPAAEHHHAIRARIAHGPLGQGHIRDVAIVMHCELPSNRKRRPLVEVAGYAKHSENRCENRSYT